MGTTSWIETVQYTLTEVKLTVNADHYFDHPLRGYVRAGQMMTTLVQEMEKAAALAGDDAPPWGLVWDCRTIRDAIEALAPRADIDKLISDARWTIGTELATSHTTNTPLAGQEMA